MTTKCPSCGENMVMVKKGWECRNPSCDVILVSIKRQETKVVKKSIVIQGGNVNG